MLISKNAHEYYTTEMKLVQAGKGSEALLAECVEECLEQGIHPRRIMLLGMVASAFQVNATRPILPQKKYIKGVVTKS